MLDKDPFGRRRGVKRGACWESSASMWGQSPALPSTILRMYENHSRPQDAPALQLAIYLSFSFWVFEGFFV